MSARFRLRRPDGKVFLERWGWECKWFGVFLHHMQAPDPGRDLHDHPWWFGSVILRGGYVEKRALTRDPGAWRHTMRRKGTWRVLRRDECHTIIKLLDDTWTLVVHGPRRGTWGFYRRLANNKHCWVEWHDYDGAGNTDIGVVD